MNALRFALCGAALLSMSPQAQEWQVNVRIVDESGEPVVNAAVQTSSGRGVVTLSISADGYYDAVQTFAISHFRGVANAATEITLVARKPERRLLVFAGDTMLARRYFEPRAHEPQLVRRNHVLEDGARLLEVIRPYIELADYASVNVETQLSAGELRGALPKSVTFYSPPELALLLRGAGFDYAALGNNHTWDYQAEGLASTIAALNAAGLDHSGAGFDEASARNPAVTAIDGKPYAFLSYVGWAGTFSPTQAAAGDKGGAALGGTRPFREDLGNVSSGATAVLQYHAGIEYSATPAGSERLRLREAVDFGADIAIGHHAHVLQGFEIYRNRLIVYSIGNFLFDQYIYATQMGTLVYVWMDGDELHRAEAVPLNINGYVPTPATGQFSYAVKNRLARLSRPFATCLRDNGAHAVIEQCVAGTSAVPQIVDIGDIEPTLNPVHLSSMGLTATQPAVFKSGQHGYRIGVDILRRGDFESSGLHGTVDRSWIEDDGATVIDDDSRLLRLVVPKGGNARTGMKVFDRVFSVSAPTTLRGRMRADADVTVRFSLQRRRIDEPLATELENGPTEVVGDVRVRERGWREFAIDFDQPRLSTRGVRLLIDVHDSGGEGATVRFDDLAWIEWRTPWLSGAGDAAQAEFGTHVQFRERL